jgi:hypothetical protein
MLRRLAVAVGIGTLAACIVRLRGHGKLTPQHGGWSELTAERLAEMSGKPPVVPGDQPAPRESVPEDQPASRDRPARRAQRPDDEQNRGWFGR